jgi:hypothetical protein
LFDLGDLAAQRANQIALAPVGEIRRQYLPDLIQGKTGPLCADDDTQNHESVGRIFAVSIGLSGHDIEQPGRRVLSAAFWIISYGIRSRARRAGIGYRYLFMHPSGRDLAQLSELIEQEKLKIIVDKTYPFARISEALAYVESGHAKGKVVVRMG